MQAFDLGIAAATLIKMQPNKSIVVDRRLNVFLPRPITARSVLNLQIRHSIPPDLQ